MSFSRHLVRLELLTVCVVGVQALHNDGAYADNGAWSTGVEAGVGSMLSSYQRDKLGYGLALQAGARAGYRVVPDLVLQGVVRSWWFPSDQGYGQATFLGAGGRYTLASWSAGTLVADAAMGLGRHGGTNRFMFEGGLGFDIPLSVLPGWSVAPTLRYAQITTTSDDVGDAPKFWSLGASFSYKPHAAVAPKVPQIDLSEAPASAPSAEVETPATDRDKDTVDDLHDACPDVAQGPFPDQAKPGCPDGDDDGDGVRNHADACPAEKSGLHPDPANLGCPLADKDDDSVPDIEDACPNKPGAPSPDHKRNGCPGLVLVTKAKIEINQQIFFATNNDRILPQSLPVMRAIADALKATTGILRVSIEGHTDRRGVSAYNLKLSQRRADSVMRWLVTNGISANRLQAHGFGDARPLANNQTSKGRALNRRVEFVIVDPLQTGAAAEPPPQ